MKRFLLAVPFFLLPLAGRAQPFPGLYVGGGLGANFLESARARAVTVGGVGQGSGSIGSNAGWAGLGSVGWGFGNGVRVELEGGWRRNDLGGGKTLSAVTSGGTETKYGVMANALFDLDIGSPYVFPYIGGGAGAQWVRYASQSASVGGPAPVTYATSHRDSLQAGVAYQAIAGVSFPVAGVPGLSVTAEYRFLAVTGKRKESGTITAPGEAAQHYAVTTSDDANHSLLLGLRYAFDVPPPPVAAAVAPAAAEVSPPVAAPAPAVAPARSYLVFFDWDSAALTGRARQIVEEAARNASREKITRIELAGHADRSGTPAFNLALSRRRAEAVAAELVKQGVARQAIAIAAFGEAKPLVPTADGVREPQNRRVEIVLR